MKSLIRDNPLGTILLSTAGILLLLILALPFVSGGVPDDKVIPAAADIQSDYEVLQISKLEPIEEFEVIKQRPLFNDDRKPVIVLTDEPVDDEALLEAEPVEPLKVRLTGVIITKDQRIAMLFDQGSKATISAAEGESLDGELSGWSVKKVEARNVSLINKQGEVTGLELVMFTQSLGKVPAKAAGASKKQTNNADKKTAAAGSKKPKKAAAKSRKADADTGNKPASKPMSAADFMRQGLEKRAAERKRRKPQKKNDGDN